MTTIEEMIETILQLKCVAEQAIEYAYESSGGESEIADQLQEALDDIMKAHHAND